MIMKIFGVLYCLRWVVIMPEKGFQYFVRLYTDRLSEVFGVWSCPQSRSSTNDSYRPVNSSKSVI